MNKLRKFRFFGGYSTKVVRRRYGRCMARTSPTKSLIRSFFTTSQYNKNRKEIKYIKDVKTIHFAQIIMSKSY